MPARKTSAWPLALAYAALIVYASLYPFDGWRDQGVPLLAYLRSPLPRYWTGFDIVANVAGYAPFGFLLALGLLRRQGGVGVAGAVAWATLAGTGISLAMESLQVFLPARVPSNVDLGLNATGTLLGAAVAGVLEWAGALARWSRFRQRWFVEDARGALALLALWPFALLFPAAVPMGLGQVMERLEAALAEWLSDTPFLEWLPVRDVELQPLVPVAELLCVALGLLVPCLLAYAVMRDAARRAAAAAIVLAVGVTVTALSAALSFGPAHAWAWLTPPVRYGLAAGAGAALLLLPVRRRGCAALALIALMLQLAVLNQGSASPYFAHTVQAWEQGRFIRFHGVVQWLGWLWPYAALAYVLIRVSAAEPPPRIGR